MLRLNFTARVTFQRELRDAAVDGVFAIDGGSQSALNIFAIACYPVSTRAPPFQQGTWVTRLGVSNEIQYYAEEAQLDHLSVKREEAKNTDETTELIQYDDVDTVHKFVQARSTLSRASPFLQRTQCQTSMCRPPRQCCSIPSLS